MWARALESALAARASADADAADESVAASADSDAQNIELEALVAMFGERVRGSDAEAIRDALFRGESSAAGAAAAAGREPRAELALEVNLGPRERARVKTVDGRVIETCALPMIFMDFVLPRRYPSASAPKFALRCDWLSNSHLSALCARLDAMWDRRDADGEPMMILAYAEYLQSEDALWEVVLNDFGVLDLASSVSMGWADAYDDARDGSQCAFGERSFEVDPRGITMARNAREAEFNVLRADAAARRRAFLESTNNRCGVCLADDIRGRDLRRPGTACEHWLCVECVHRMASVHVRDGSVTRLICPEPGCATAFMPHVLREVLSSEEFERYDSMLLAKTLDAMPDLVYCPRCEHPVLEDEGDDSHCGRCPGCMYAFCTLCRSTFHPPSVVCLSAAQKLAVLEARRVGDEKMSAEALRQYRENLADAMASAYVAEKGKLCPTCGAGVIKNEGCNKMTCACGSYFCWLCGAKLSGDGYAHFRNVDGEPGASACRLFDIEEIERFENEMANMRLQNGFGDDGAPRGRAADIVRCIRCKAANARFDNNNHVRCWSCRTSFCAACRSVVPRGSDHYGAGSKCKQHAR